MSSFFGVGTSSAKYAVHYLFSFVSSDHGDALKFGADITADCNIATLEARTVGQLASARTLTPGGGPIALRAAMAEADQRIKKADTAMLSAGSRLKDMTTKLGQDGPGVGDAREAVKSAGQAVETAKLVLTAVTAAHGAAVPWYVQDGRLTCGVGARLEALEKIRPGSTTALQRTVVQARGQLDAAPGCGGSKWDEKGVISATKTATGTIDQLLLDIANAEGGLGQDSDRQLFDLREQALRRYAEQGTAGWPDIFDKTLARLQEANPELRANHLSDLNDAVTGEMMRARKAIVGAATPEAVQHAVEEALKSLRVVMGNLAKQVGSTAGLGRVKVGAEEKLKQEQEREAYADAMDAAEDALERLRIAEAPQYADLRKRCEAIRTEAERSGDLAGATATDLPALTLDATKALADHEDAVAKKLDPLHEQLERLLQAFEDKELELRGSKDAGIQALLKAIKADLDDATDFLDCQGNVDAAAPAAGILDHAEQLLDEFDDAAEGLTRQAGTIKTVEDRLKRLDTRLVPADDIAVLQRKITALRSALGAMTDKDLQGQLDAIGDGIGRLDTFATDLAKWREAARKSLAEGENGFRAYAQAVAKASFTGARPDPSKGGIRAMLDALAQQIDAPALPLTFAADSQAWDSRLRAMTQALLKVWDGKSLVNPAEAVKDGQVGQDREQAAQEAEAKAKTLTRALTAAGKTIPVTGTARGEYQMLQQALETAGPLVKTDPQTALLQLEDIEARMARLPGTPEFNQAVTRTIAAVPKQWQDALALTRQRLKDLSTAIGTAAGNTPFAQGISGIGTILDHAADVFEPAAFTPAITVLADAKRTAEERRAARETALRTVRQYQSLLMGDPLVRHVQANPFKVPVFGPLFRLLEMVELELSRVAC